MLFYVAFVELTKAFVLLNRKGWLKILAKIGCHSKLQSMIESFYMQ